MPTFQFEAMDSTGQEIKDVLEAPNEEEAQAVIRQMGYFVTKISVKKSRGGKTAQAAGSKQKKKPGRSFAIGGVNVKQLTAFTRQLSILQDAGLPILRSLNILEKQAKPGPLKNSLMDVCDEIEAGSTLSEAMSKSPKAFNRLYVNMIKAGEAGGVLDTILDRLSHFMEKSLRLKKKIMGAMIYPIVAHSVWGGGLLSDVGGKPVMDFAGSSVVHLTGATAGLAVLLLLGARKGKYGANGQINAIPGCNLPLATLGTLILWLGWFGFNGGSELKVSDVGEANAVSLVFVNTNMAAAGGLVLALLLSRFWFGKADLTMALNGALAGLVAITAEPLTPEPIQAMLIGGVGGLLVVGSIVALDKLRIDDPVGAISVHGVVGIWGLLAVCFTNGGLAQLPAQLIGIASIFAWVFGASFAVWFVIKKTLGIRVSDEEEYEGVDISECGLEAYPEFAAAE